MIEKMMSPWRRKDTKWNEDRAVPSKKEGLFRRALVTVLKLVLIAAFLGSIGGAGGMWLSARSERSKLFAIETENATETTKTPETNIASTDSVSGSANDPGGVGVLSSENYRVGQIVLGGDVGVLSQGDEYTELAIADIRGETLGSKNQNEGRALITWKTSKAARSTLRYSKTSGGSEKTIDEDGFGMSHSAVLSGLDMASTYLYTVTVRDRFGNEVTSDSHAVYTGTRVVSLFELITNALQEVFGWAVKK